MKDDPYRDIISLPHHNPEQHARMSRSNRAAQFAPFSALAGYDAAVEETARLTEVRAELTEDAKAILDRKLRTLAARLAERPRVTITFFRPDTKKTGGAYLDVTGTVKKIDEYQHAVMMEDGTAIPINDIYGITEQAGGSHQL